MKGKELSSSEASTRWSPWHIVFFLGFVIALSFLTYFWRYWDPPHVFWDENYHIASAQKYLHGVYFMEQHPPLGKLLVALGEKIFHPNARTDQFLGTDYGTDFAEGFSFVGYRFFSALLAWWTAPLLFFIFYLLTRNPLTSSVLSFLYIFDNALIVHLRGAMLEGPLLFFCTLTLLCFFLQLEWRDRPKRFYWMSAAFGAAFALVATTKLLGLIMVLLIPGMLWMLLETKQDRQISTAVGGCCALVLLAYASLIRFLRVGASPMVGVSFIALCALVCVAAGVLLWQHVPRLRRGFIGLACMLPAFLLVYCSVWQIHFSLGSNVNPQLPDNGYYQASAEYKQILTKHTNGSLANFPAMLRDSLAYVGHYNSGAPRLDLCKEDENGSPFYFWPFGARTINYRWETPDGKTYRYLYLVPNPVAWWSALLGLFIACAFLLTSLLLPLRQPLKRPTLLGIFIGMYLAYLIAVSRIERVLYLYHYFIPLLLTFLILGLVLEEIQAFAKWKMNENGKMIAVMLFGVLIFLGHQFYRPLTYYEPLTDAQFERRDIFSLWELHCVNCQHVSGLVIPTKAPGQ